MKPELRAAYMNPPFIMGVVILILGMLPLLVGGFLDLLGIVDIGNALGLGVLMVLSFPIATVFLIVGSVVAFKRIGKRRDGW
ncbi:MAG: hypothetical protein ACRD16_04250 [Thermoanaerobaculia bacterium]